MSGLLRRMCRRSAAPPMRLRAKREAAVLPPNSGTPHAVSLLSRRPPRASTNTETSSPAARSSGSTRTRCISAPPMSSRGTTMRTCGSTLARPRRHGAMRARCRPAPPPGLEHQNGPQRIGPVAAALDVIRPQLTDRTHVEIAAAELLRIEQVLRPVAQRTAQPTRQRHTEAHLRTIDQVARHVAVEHAAQQPLRLAAAHLEMPWQGPGKFDDSMVEQRWPRFKR